MENKSNINREWFTGNGFKYSISVQIHPKRKKYLPYLLKRLGTEKYAMDRENDIWETARRAWLSYDEDADYHFVIQDDSLITSMFHDKLKKHLESTKGREYCFVLYTGRPRMRKHIRRAKREGFNHLLFKRIYNEVALGLPVNHIDEMVEYCDQYGDGTCRWIQRYIQSKKMLAYYTMPSLIDHRDEDSLHNNNKGVYVRKANWFEP